VYCAALLFVKMTFLFQYYRGLATKRTRPVFIVAMVVVGGLSLAQCLIPIFGCSPIQASWDITVQDATCINVARQYYVNAAINIVTDVAVLIIPIIILSRVNLVRTQKLMLIGVFSLGFL
jgi:predicted transglutaminase-like protease